MTSTSATHISFKAGARTRPNQAKDLLMDAPIASPDHTTEEVLQMFTEHASVVALPVVEGSLPIGLINRNMFMDNLAKPFRREIFARKSCIAFMDKSPLVVDQDTTLQDLSFMAVQAGSKALNDGFIITDGTAYRGVGTGFDLMRAISTLQAHKNRLVMESIDYASLIQKSYLRPFRLQMEATLSDHFMHWAPRDVVGGDFYHFKQRADGFFAAVIDCTGHGVPGAFMTMIMAASLDHILDRDNCRDPAALLGKMNETVKETLGQFSNKGGTADESLTDDGMDAAFLWVEPAQRRLVYAGARTPLYLSAAGQEEILQLDGDRKGVGYRETPPDYRWTNRELRLPEDACVYVSSDGIVDQIGGERRIAFGKKRLKQLFQTYRHLPMAEQETAIVQAFLAYQGSEERRDDVTLFGFRV